MCGAEGVVVMYTIIILIKWDLDIKDTIGTQPSGCYTVGPGYKGQKWSELSYLILLVIGARTVIYNEKVIEIMESITKYTHRQREFGAAC